MGAKKAEEAEDAAGAEDAASLAAEVAALKAELARMAERLGHRAEAEAEAQVRALAEEWRRLEGEIAEGARRNPWRSLGIAALAGLVLGLILRR